MLEYFLKKINIENIGVTVGDGNEQQEEKSGENVDEMNSPTPSSETPQTNVTPVTDNADQLVDTTPNVDEAATMIQATFRGYKTRKELKSSSSRSEQADSETQQEQAAEPSAEEAQKPDEQSSAVDEEQKEVEDDEQVVPDTSDSPVERIDTPVERVETPVERVDTPAEAEVSVSESAVDGGEEVKKEDSVVETPQPAAQPEAIVSEAGTPTARSPVQSNLDLAAIRIQATYRGFKTRKDLRKGIHSTFNHRQSINFISA